MRNNRTLIYFCTIFSIISGYTFNRTACFYQRLSGDIMTKTNETIDHIFIDISNKPFYLGLDKNSVIAGLIGVALIWLISLYNAFNTKNYLHGKEHGSADWGNSEDIKKFIDKKDFDRNMIFTSSETMTIDTRQTFRNNNILVIGGSGSGKTRFFLEPNLMQMHSSYVITDPKGTVLPECGKMLEEGNYEIRVFNTIKFDKSMHYNPFAYIKEEKDILKLVNTIIMNTSGEGEKAKEDFWVKAEKLLYHALIGYIWYELKDDEKNFSTLLYLLNSMEAKEEDENFKSPVDILFEELEEKDADHFAVRQYKKFKQAAGKTAKSILVSCGARLSPFDIKVLRDITAYDELRLDTIGDNKTALFIIVDDTDITFNFIVAILYMQLFNELCNKADNEYGGRLPFHVRCLLDEFANIGQIPNFEKLIATMRSREISASVIVQNMSQIKGLYKEQAGTIVGNCDTLLFLGSGEEETQKSISTRVGKTTIDHTAINESKGQNGSYSMNQQIIARDLITPSEVGLLDTDECLLFIRGVKPFRSKKFDIKKHIRYKHLAEYDKSNTYDIIEIKRHEAAEFLKNVNEVEEVNDLSELNVLT